MRPLWMCWVPVRVSTQRLDWNRNWFTCFALRLKRERAGARLLRLWWSRQKSEVSVKILCLCKHCAWILSCERVNLCVHVCAPFSPTPTYESSCSASRGGPGSQSPTVVGTRQWRPVPSSILYSSVQRAARQQLDCPLCFSEPWDTLLHCGQVNVKDLVCQQLFIFYRRRFPK